MGGEASVRVSHIDIEHRDCEPHIKVSRRREKGESMPAITLHGKEAPVDQAQDEGGVSVYVQGLVRPGLDSLDSRAELCDIIGQLGAYEVEYVREATWGYPGGTSNAVGMAIVEGGTICPDMLPCGRHTAWASKRNRGGRGVFLEETLVSGIVSKVVWSGKKGLGRVKQMDAAEGIGH